VNVRKGGEFRSADFGLGGHKQTVRGKKRTITNNARTRSSGRSALLSTGNHAVSGLTSTLTWLAGTLQHHTGEYDGSHGLPREQGVVRVLQQLS
jgi:hypothetical protein